MFVCVCVCVCVIRVRDRFMQYWRQDDSLDRCMQTGCVCAHRQDPLTLEQEVCAPNCPTGGILAAALQACVWSELEIYLSHICLETTATISCLVSDYYLRVLFFAAIM